MSIVISTYEMGNHIPGRPKKKRITLSRPSPPTPSSILDHNKAHQYTRDPNSMQKNLVVISTKHDKAPNRPIKKRLEHNPKDADAVESHTFQHLGNQHALGATPTYEYKPRNQNPFPKTQNLKSSMAF